MQLLRLTDLHHWAGFAARPERAGSPNWRAVRPPADLSVAFTTRLVGRVYSGTLCVPRGGAA